MRRASALLLCIAFAACGGSSTDATVACPPLQGALPGTRSGPLPWPAELNRLDTRLFAIGLKALHQEGTAQDVHFNVGISINGSTVVLPSNIGINGKEVTGGRMVTGYVSAIHTHDSSGLVHIHSPEVVDHRLGQFFDVWGLAFGADRIGGYCAGEGKRLTVLVNGRPVQGDPRELVLAQDQRIAIRYG